MKYFIFLTLLNLYAFANAHIFVYHRFEDPRYSSANTSNTQLIEQFEYFKNNNYKVVPLDKIYQYLKDKKDIPSNWIALTIDDAYKSFYNHGLEIFKKYNYPFTLFVYVEATNKRYGDFMTWNMLKDAKSYGKIALHSYKHPHLLDLNNTQIIYDTKKAYEIFEKKMGFKPKYYAYPYGEYDQRVQDQIKKFDFDMILNQNTGSVKINSNLSDIYRTALVGKVNIKQKLKYSTLDVEWLEPKEFPKDGVLKLIKAKVDPSIKNIKLYITSEGWADIKVKNGIITHKLNTYLKRARTRISLSTDYYKIGTKIIIKKTNKKRVNNAR